MLKLWEGIDSNTERGKRVENYAEWFSQRLNKALGSHKQAEIARLMTESGFEMSATRLGHYFTARRYPDPPVLREIARALGVSADWLLGLTEEPMPANDLNESLLRERGEGKFNSVMRALSPDKQNQVLQYAEFLLGQQEGGNPGEKEARTREERDERLRAFLDSVEVDMGGTVRRQVEKIARSKGLAIGSTS